MIPISAGLLKKTKGKDIKYHDLSVVNDLHCVAHRYPEFDGGDSQYNEFNVIRRDGVTFMPKYTNEDTTLKFQLLWFRTYEPEKGWREKIQEIRAWLYGTGPERLYEHEGWFWRVKKTSIDFAQQIDEEVATVTITFTVDPHEYLESGRNILAGANNIYGYGVLANTQGQPLLTDDGHMIRINKAFSWQEADGTGVIYNPYAPCHPIYILNVNSTGTISLGKGGVKVAGKKNGQEAIAHFSGKVLVIPKASALTADGDLPGTVYTEGKALVINEFGNIVIDTDRMIAYNAETKDAVYIDGDYSSLWLDHGYNYPKTTGGITYKIIPNWRAY